MGADRGKVGSGVVDVGIGHVGGDRLQDLQDLGTVGAATEQGEGEVLSHGRARIGGQLKGKGSGCQVGRGTAGAVEGDHRLGLCQSAEELGAPFAGIVGDLVADFVAGHGFRLKWGGGPSPPPTVVKDLTQDLSRWRVVSLGGFASGVIIGSQGGGGTPLVPVCQAATSRSFSQRAKVRTSSYSRSAMASSWRSCSAFRMAALHWAAISSIEMARSVAGL